MRVALLADLHGNADAAAAVLDDARAHGVEQLLIAGDFVGYYYEPDRVLDLLAQWTWTAVAGNHEVMFAQWRRGDGRLTIASKYGSGLAEAEAKLGPDAIARLDALPAVWRGSIGGRTVLMCHGTPWDADAYVYPDDQTGTLQRMAEGGEDLVMFGHTHYPVLVKVGATQVVNPGSVGQPRDRNPDAAWALWNTSDNGVTLMRTPYDQAQLIEQCRAHDPSLPYLSQVLTRR